MKFSQLAAIVVTLLISVGVVMWLARSVPSEVFEKSSATESSTEDNHEDHGHEYVEEGVYLKNPFTIDPKGPHPKAVLVEELYSFEPMALGQTGSHHFVIKNEGTVPLKLAKGRVQCKCTVNGLKDETVLPGEEASILLEWTPKTEGEFGQGADIWTNDPEHLKLNIRVEGNVLTQIQVSPTNGWTLGAIPSSKPVSLKGEIFSSFFDAFEISSIETSSENLKVEAVPMQGFELEYSQAKVGYKIVGVYTPPEEAGAFLETVKIKTTLENFNEFEFQVSGSRSGPVSIVGPGWTAGNRNLDLGRIAAENGKTQRLTFMFEPAESAFEISEIVVIPDFVKVSLTPETNPENAKRLRYTLLVEVPPQSPKGLWTSAEPGKILIKTTHPKLEEIPLNLVLAVQ